MPDHFSDLPRTRLAHLPTPLEPLTRLTAELAGPSLWVKRDDCTGLATGGNKTRKLEFLIGAAEAAGADTIITFGAVQSNHARQTAAACAARGLDCHLILARKVPWRDPSYETLGNVLLDHMFGATVHLVEPEEVKQTLKALRTELDDQNRTVYSIPTGGSNGTGALGYAACMLELIEQSKALGFELTDVAHATASAGTQAGLLAGLMLAGKQHEIRVHGINVSEGGADLPAFIAQIGEIADEALRLLGVDQTLDRDAILVDSSYLGEGYGLPTPETFAALKLLAGSEGLLLDPVYSGKAMSGFIGKIRAGEFSDVEDLVFIHTGGTASLPVYGEAILA